MPARPTVVALAVPGPLDLGLTLAPLRRGRADQCTQIGRREVWRASRTPDGPVTLHLHHARPDRVVARAWGPGRDWALEHASDLIGLGDDPTALDPLLAASDGPERRLLDRLHRTHPGLRIPCSLAVAEAATPTVLEQRVTGPNAWRSYRALVRDHGEPPPFAPDLPVALRLPPAPDVLGALASWEFHRLGVERRRADTIRRVGRVARRLDAAAPRGPAEAGRVLGSIAGIGPWTVAEVSRVALGDADAVSVGDFHLPHQVAWVFRGKARSDDAELLELLEPYAGQRGRVVRLVGLSGISAPARGPRRATPDIRVL